MQEILPNPRFKTIFYYAFFQGFHSFRFFIWVNFLHKRRHHQSFFFLYGCLIIWTSFVENSTLSLVNCLCIFVKLSILWAYIQTLCSVPLIYLPTCMPVPHCLDHCSFVGNLKVSFFKYSNIILFQHCFWLFQVLGIKIWILESACKFLPKNSDGIVIKSVDQFGDDWHPNNIESSMMVIYIYLS
jgi:hypothetical protein